jgi:hypothetical protein
MTMSNKRLVQGLRGDARHWLPSQGVDPAPLAELNAECLGMLVRRAADSWSAERRPGLLGMLRRQWLGLSPEALQRLASAPFTVFDAGFEQAPRWLQQRTRAVGERAQRVEPPFFDLAAARSITRRSLVYGWHLARSRPRAACLVFGATGFAVESLAACSLVALESAADKNAESLRPRWANQYAFWDELLSAASAQSESRLRELFLGGLQRLAAETLAAHAR